MPPIFKNIEYNKKESGEYRSQIIVGSNGKFLKSRN